MDPGGRGNAFAPVLGFPAHTGRSLMKLYMSPGSGNAYKVRLLLEMLKVPYEKYNLDTKNKEHKSPAFPAINPRGQMSALEDDGRKVWDSTAAPVCASRT